MYRTPNDLSVISMLITGFYTKRKKYSNEIKKIQHLQHILLSSITYSTAGGPESPRGHI